MSGEPSLETLLAQLKTALQEDRDADSERLIDQIVRRLENRRQEDAQTTARVEAIQTADETAVQRVQTQTEYLGAAAETDIQRAQFLASAQKFLQAQSGTQPNPESEALVETVEQTRQQEQTITQRQSAVESGLEEVSIPSALTVVSVTQDPQTVPVGTPFTVSVTLKNVGETVVRDVELSIKNQTQSGLSPGESSETIGEIAAGAERTQTVTFTPQSSGVYSLRVTARGRNGTSGSDVLTVTIPGFSLAEFDRNDTGQIEFDDLRYATREYNRENITFDQLRRVLRAYNTDQQV
jgi:hypothetical protein